MRYTRMRFDIWLCLPLVHSLGAKLGIFPYFFAPRLQKGEKAPSEWD